MFLCVPGNGTNSSNLSISIRPFNSFSYFYLILCYNLICTSSSQRTINLESFLNEKLEEIIKTLKGVQAQQKDDFSRLEKRLLGFEKSLDFINNY